MIFKLKIISFIIGILIVYSTLNVIEKINNFIYYFFMIIIYKIFYLIKND